MIQTSVGITLNSIKNILSHTHSSLECILLLKGKLQEEINGDIYHMSPYLPITVSLLIFVLSIKG